jgi:hypothetical protein
MTLQQYTVAYSVDKINFTALTNVQSITINIGRQAQLDQVKTGSGSVVLRYPTGYVSPIAGLVSGTQLYIENSTPGQPEKYLYYGVISDVSIEYGIPYSGGVGNADYVTISFEGAFASFGRMQANDYVLAAGTMVQQTVDVQTQSGLYFGFISNGSDPQMAATTVSTTWGDWVAKACQTLNARIQESYLTALVLSPFYKIISTVNFSDTTNNATNQIYNKINFGSIADNFYTQVTVAPESFSSATVTNAGATAPFRTLQTNTFNASTAQATDFANFLLGNYGLSRSAILSVTCSAEAQSSFALDSVGQGDALYLAIGAQVAVAFRGTTYQCIIEGVTVSATPAGASYTFYFSGADLNNTLILNNTTFGKLDSNRLGY